MRYLPFARSCALTFSLAVLTAFGTAQLRTYGRTPGETAAGATPTNISPPGEPPREFRGVWLTTVANMDWPRKGSPVATQQRELLEMIETAARLHLNAIIFQVRPCGDALYASQLEPWSEFLTGRQGQSPTPAWDPLEFVIRESHKRSLEVHAWLNPYRASHPTESGPKAPNHISSLRPDLVKKYGKYTWMDPGEPEVTQHTLNVVMDIVRRYDVDGIHFDDYFYPYRERDASGKLMPFPDDASWAKYKATGGTLERDDWRRESVNRLVLGCYQNIKATKPHVKFGLSPFGSWRPNNPPGAKTMDPYAELYADSRKWWHQGWVDYLTPQLYWLMDNPSHGFRRMFDWWVQENRAERHLWPGVITSNIALKPAEWTPEEILRKIEYSRKQPGAPGLVHFRMNAFTRNMAGINEKLLAGPYAGFALVPKSPWIDNTAPAQPRLEMVTGETAAAGQLILKWTATEAEPVKHWCLYQLTNGSWTWVPVGADQTQVVINTSTAPKPTAVALSILDLAGNESPRSILAIP